MSGAKSAMDLPNILNNRGPAAVAAADQSLHHYTDLNGRPISDTGSERGLSPHMSDHSSRFPSRPGSQLHAMNMTSAPHPQHQFSMVPNPYPTPTESIESGYAHAQNDDQHLQGASNAVEGVSQAKAFACSTCGKGFARRSDLARHERIHSGVRPHVCDYAGCGKQFIQRSALTVHSRVHTGEKPHMCEHCTKPFSDSSSLARHRRIHSGKRPYKCPYADCQKTFTRRTTLTRHQSHHTGTVEESIAAASAVLASRPPNPPQRTRSDGAQFSEIGSTRSSPNSDHNMSTPQVNGDMGQTPLMPRQGNDFAYMGNLPPHLRGDFSQNSPRSGSTSPSLSGFGLGSGRPSFTSHPNTYAPPPPPLEPPTQNESRGPGSASGSPHLSSLGWQSPTNPGMGSPVPGNYAYPDPSYELQPASLYYGNGQQRRPQSTEPDQYELKPRMQNEVWASQLS